MLIIDTLTASQHFAELASDVQNSELFTILIQIAAYITPYFLIPATFKFGLGVFGNLAGMINDRGRGFFDKQRKFREGSRASMRQRAREGKRYQGGREGGFRDKFNRGIANSMNAPGAITESGSLLRPGQWASSTRGRSSTLQHQAVERAMKENAGYQTWRHNDELNKAASESIDAKSLRDNLVNNYGYAAGSQRLDDAVNQVESTRRSMGAGAFRQMTTLSAIAGGTAIKTSGEMAAMIGKASGNDDNTRAWLVAQGRSAAKGAGRLDQSEMGFGDLYAESGAFAAKYNRGEAPTEADIQESTDRLSSAAYKSGSGAYLTGQGVKPEAVRQLAPAAVAHVEAAIKSGDHRLMMQSLASMSTTQDGLRSSGPEKASIWADTVMDHEVNVPVAQLPENVQKALTAQGMMPNQTHIRASVQQLVDWHRQDSEFNQVNRELTARDELLRGSLPEPPQPPPEE